MAASIDIQVTTPQAGATVWGSTSGVKFDISGTITVSSAPQVYDAEVWVRLGSTGTMKAAQIQGNKWSYSGLATVSEGPLTITIQARGWYYGIGDDVKGVDEIGITKSVNHSVTVSFDRTAPQVTVFSLSNGGKVYGPDPVLEATIKGSATDQHTEIAWLECGIDGANFVRATPSGTAGWSEWTTVCKVPHGIHKLTARAADTAGNVFTTQPIDIEAVDNTAPTVVIQEPPDYFTKLGDETGAKITVSGTATDVQSGVNSIWLTVDGRPEVTQATQLGTNWSTWSAEVKVPPDFHIIKVHARDNKNNVSAPTEKPVRASLSYKPQDQEDNVSPLAYLRDLLEFARSHVTVTSQGGQPRQLELEDLTQEFFQPLGDLTSNEQVRQLRVCIEVLRKLFPPSPTDVAHWKFDEGSGTTTADASGNGNNGTLQGPPTWSAGRVGAKALSFDGLDDYVQVGAAAKLVMTNSLSISAWIHPKGVGSSATEGGIIVNKEGEYEVARFPDGTIRWSFDNSAPDWGWINTGYVAPINRWTHVAIVYDKGIIKTYANGRLVHRYAGSGIIGDHDTTRNDFRIGGRQSTSQYFNGLIDDVRICNRALGTREVAILATPPARLVAHWKFDEGSGTTTADASGNGSNGTLQGPTWVTGKAGAWALGFDGVDDVVTLGAASVRDVTNDFTVAFWANPQEIHEIDEESPDGIPSGISGTSGQRYAIVPHQGQIAYGSPDHACAGVSIGTNGISVYEHSDSYMPPLLVHQAPISGWTHVAVVYRDKRPGLYVNGILVNTGLKSPKGFVHMNPQTLGGMTYGRFRGQMDDVRVYDHVLSAREIAQLAGVAAVATEADYRQAAYHTLLNRLGTSYEEIRLARGADEETRKALANRLGLDSDAARVGRLDMLMLRPEEITEAALEKLFGLADTSRDPLVARPVPDLLTWRLEHLRTLWKAQDHPTDQDADSLPPIIDPDLLRQDDLISPTPGKPNPASTLWVARTSWVNALLSRLASDRKPGETVKDRFERLVGTTKLGSMAELLTLDAQRKQGKDIGSDLRQKRVSTEAFSYLIRMHKLAVAGSLLESEWSDVYSILVQVEKLYMYKNWHAEEANLTLSTDYFNLPTAEVRATAPSSAKLPAWRATERERRAWLNKLRARADQELAVEQGMRAVVDSTEEATLPVLRDALVATVSAPAADGGQSTADVFNWLTDWLQIDVKSTGRQKTTRINQAIETVQGTLFSLRTNRFKDVESQLELVSVYPRPDWKLAVSTSDFDQEWAWMGSYATWRAAMLVFLYPENLLLPSLRGKLTQEFKIEQSSGSFKKLVENMRGQLSLTPDTARRQANEYLTRLRTEPLTGVLPTEFNAPFEITEQLNEAQLQARATQVRDLFTKYAALDKKSELFYVREVFYFVPIQIALQLQKSRQYTAALDWFQTVYAYNLPVEKRKIYYGLVLESSIQSSYERVLTKWLLGDLNPHIIATKRKDAYTRFTLLSMVRCFLDFADSEFTNDTGESISRARTLYLSALDLLDVPELQTPKDFRFAPNPVIQAMRLHAELNLFKMRDNRNIAGMQRQTEVPPPTRMINSLPTVGGGGQLTLPGAQTPRPTPYRYSVLMERAKHLVALAQQIEAAYFAALERTGAEGYTELKARQDLDLAKASVDLQAIRVTEANGGVTLAELQQQRSQFQANHYKDLIEAGLITSELGSLAAQWTAVALHGLSAVLGIWSAETLLKGGSNIAGQAAAAVSSTSSALATVASYERREQEWQFQLNLAQQDVGIGAQQITSARDRVRVVNQELNIARTHDVNANAAVDFLTTGRFATAELYEWMSGILGRVYDYFLQQATATARLAQSQLAFERQEGALSIIQADYWQPPSEGGTMQNGSSDGQAPDRQGITGSARLLQDIYQLDQYGFETDKRKLQLTKTISLARTAPLELQRFRDTGVLPFAIPMEIFDRDFPGHYLRLIKRVRTSVVALVPPTQGIRATLATTGVSRVTTSNTGIFQTVPVYRDPELVALSSPNDATGLFELDQQSDMLLPFEAMGVDTSWELQMPKAANPFDYRTIADVLFTIEYTALNSFDYRQQVVQELDRAISADCPVSLRQQFPDQWYDLHNPDQATPPAMTISFDIRREDLPPNIDDLRIQHLSLYMVPFDGQPFAKPLTVSLHFTPKSGTENGGGASSTDGVFSTRRGNANEWLNKICNQVPEGTWRLALPNTQEVKDLFNDEVIEDILLVITYSGTTPEWPI